MFYCDNIPRKYWEKAMANKNCNKKNKIKKHRTEEGCGVTCGKWVILV